MISLDAKNTMLDALLDGERYVELLVAAGQPSGYGREPVKFAKASGGAKRMVEPLKWVNESEAAWRRITGVGVFDEPGTLLATKEVPGALVDIGDTFKLTELVIDLDEKAA